MFIQNETGDYMETTFFISKNTSVTSKQLENEVIGHACEILQRDILTVVTDTRKANEIELVLLDEKNETDAFHILFVSPDKVKVYAETPLGLMYGVLEISHKILDVQPFWYFMDIPPIKKPFIEWTDFDLTLPDFATDYRGWFVKLMVAVSMKLHIILMVKRIKHYRSSKIFRSFIAKSLIPINPFF